MKILVTGGLGYIGSHTVIELLRLKYSVVIVDNLCNSSYKVLDRIEALSGEKVSFYKADVTDEDALDKVFSTERFDGIMHFAGLKAVGESVRNPIDYYYTNVTSTLTLSKLCIKYGVTKLIFSSSATVYGDNISPLYEDMELMPTTNPYGESKAINERILIDLAQAYSDFSVTILRYFNPIGAHESGLLGEKPNGIPNNLMPYITKVAKGELPYLNIYGNDYETVDGTGIRDYIHVVDLARGHVNALSKLQSGVEIYNLGTGKGISVLELVKAFERVNGIKIPYKITNRRTGDIAICYADVTKAKDKLNWIAQYTIDDMVRDAWRFEQNKHY